MDKNQTHIARIEGMTRYYRFAACTADGVEVGHVWLYCMQNNLGKGPCAYIEDLWVDEKSIGPCFTGQKLVREAIAFAKEVLNCYKVVLVADEKLAKYYGRLGFRPRGREFLIKFNGEPF